MHTELQTKLLSLSQNSKQIIAEKSGHFIIIDRPDVVIDAVRQVVQATRNSAKLSVYLPKRGVIDVWTRGESRNRLVM
jgi:hypothetical protein